MVQNDASSCLASLARVICSKVTHHSNARTPRLRYTQLGVDGPNGRDLSVRCLGISKETKEMSRENTNKNGSVREDGTEFYGNVQSPGSDRETRHGFYSVRCCKTYCSARATAAGVRYVLHPNHWKQVKSISHSGLFPKHTVLDYKMNCYGTAARVPCLSDHKALLHALRKEQSLRLSPESTCQIRPV